MKYLSTKLIKLLVIIFTIVNGAFFYWRFSQGENLPNAIADFSIFQVLLITLYVIYISCVVWINESISNINYRVNKSEESNKLHLKTNTSKIDELSLELASISQNSFKTLQEIGDSRNSIGSKIKGISDVLFTLSQENEIYRSKLLMLQNSLDVSTELLNNFESNINDEINTIKTDLLSEQSALDKKIISLRNDLISEQSALDTNIDSLKDKLLHASNFIVSDSKKAFDSLNTRLNQEEKKLADMAQNIKSQNYYNYNRVDALFSIHQLIKLRSPLPIMHDWAISSDYAHYLLRTILNKGKGNIIDIGSGISTILLGYAVERNGSGKVISLEHDKEYYERTLELIKEHKLDEYVQLNYCPLIDYKIGEKSWLWYDISEVNIPKNISLISIDGPPGNTQKLARYPAVPLLKAHIRKGTTVLLDDAKRQEEEEIAELWKNEYYLSKEFIEGYKGIFKLEK